MIRALFILLLAVGATQGVSAQHAGQSADEVRKALGDPSAVLTTSDGEKWIYTDGTKLLLQHGVVVGSSGSTTTATIKRDGVEDASDGASSVTILEAPTGPGAKSSGKPRAASQTKSPGSKTLNQKPAREFNTVFILAIIVAVVCRLWFWAVAFGESFFWGLACIFVPFASFVFLLQHWSVAKAPFLTTLIATAVCIAMVLSDV